MRMSLTGIARRGCNGLSKHLARVIVPSRVQPTLSNSDLKFIGEGDGAWPVLESLLPNAATCYCVGVGVNATFDIALAAMGHEVHSFDPTPRALSYAKNIGLAGKGVAFHSIGIWNEQKTLRFFAPSNSAHANFSVVDLHGTGDYVEASCERLADIMKRNGHTKLDLFKLDVEGSWGPILDDLLDSQIYPTQLCAEFDSPTSTRKILRMVRRLEAVGYETAWFHRENFLFTLTNPGRAA